MKKIISIFLVLALGLAFLAGCGAADRDAGTGGAVTGEAIEETGGSGSSAAAPEAGAPDPGSAQAGAPGSAPAGQDAAAGQGTAIGGGTPAPDQAGGQGSNAGDTPAGQTAGNPAPVEPQDAAVDKKTELHCTLSITCKTIPDNLDKFDQVKLELVPEDGVIYRSEEAVFYEGESVFDVLLRETRQNKIHMEFVGTPGYNSNYIEGINNIYEFDCGELSGWMYKVNDWFPNYGSSRYALKDGDRIEWIYTCDLGRDIGGDWKAQNQTEEQQSR